MARKQREIRRGACLPGRNLQWSIIMLSLLFASCMGTEETTIPTLRWYVFNEPSGAFRTAAKQCSTTAKGAYQIETFALPADSDEQRVQLVRRLAAREPSIDIIGMDVIWTAEFAEAGWILPWKNKRATQAQQDRLQPTVESATYKRQLWATPFTSNIQLLWYRSDHVEQPPKTWNELLQDAEALGTNTLQVQGARYEGLTVFFNSLLASAGGSILDKSGERISLEEEPTQRALTLMRRIATSRASNSSLPTAREDEARLAFEAGSSFMINYTYVWPSAKQNAPQVFANMAWDRWPAVTTDKPSRVTLGGINLSVNTYSQYPELAFEAALCLASEKHQRLVAEKGGLLPTRKTLYDDPQIRQIFPFADTLRRTLQEAV